jgi:hypothetical protein
MAKGVFTRSMDKLLAQMPKRSLKGKVEVDQVYAHYQHENPQFNHPRGGGAFYLRDPLYSKSGQYLARLARHVVSTTGVVGLESAMRNNMEDLADEIISTAPVEHNDLRHSGHPTVAKDGEIVYDRPPDVPRLSESELKARDRNLRYLDRGI